MLTATAPEVRFAVGTQNQGEYPHPQPPPHQGSGPMRPRLLTGRSEWPFEWRGNHNNRLQIVLSLITQLLLSQRKPPLP